MAGEGELARALHELLRQGRHQDLAGSGGVGQTAGHDDRVPEDVIVLYQGVPGVYTDVNTDRLAVLVGLVVHDGALDLDGTAQGAGDTTEGDHEAVALDLDLAAAVAVQRLAHDPVVVLQQSV